MSLIFFNLFLLAPLILVAVRIYIINDLKISIQLTDTQKLIFILTIGAILVFIAGAVGIGGYEAVAV